MTIGRKPRNETATITHIKARVTEDELKSIREQATAEKATVADFIRVRLGLRVL